jgi:hypothetical protein
MRSQEREHAHAHATNLIEIVNGRRRLFHIGLVQLAKVELDNFLEVLDRIVLELNRLLFAVDLYSSLEQLLELLQFLVEQLLFEQNELLIRRSLQIPLTDEPSIVERL